jgi:hypothetical protein
MMNVGFIGISYLESTLRQAQGALILMFKLVILCLSRGANRRFPEGVHRMSPSLMSFRARYASEESL